MTKSRHIPLRSCIACGAKMPKSQLVRIRKTEQMPIAVDTNGKGPGRGSYVCKTPGCWRRILEKKILDRTLKQSLSATDLESVMTYYRENVAPGDTHLKL